MIFAHADGAYGQRWKSILMGIGGVSAILLAEPSAAQIVLPSSSSGTVQLNTSYPGETNFQLPADGLISNSGAAIQGDSSQNWQFTNYGTVQAGSSSTASGVKLGGINQNTSRVDNYGSISSASTTSNGPSGVQFTNGGLVYNLDVRRRTGLPVQRRVRFDPRGNNRITSHRVLRQ